MFKLILALLAILPTMALAAPPIIWNGSSAQLLTPSLLFQEAAGIYTGTQDPTVTAVSANKGSLFIRTGASGGSTYQKQDDGLTTNWVLFEAGSGVSWGDITGTLSDQTDLQAALDAKQDVVSASPSTLAWFNASGDLDYLSQWSVDDLQYLSNITSVGSGDSRVDFGHLRIQTNLDGTVSGTARSIWTSLQGSGTIASLSGWQFEQGLPVVGSANLLTISNGGAIGGDLVLASFSNNAAISGDLYASSIETSNTVGGDYVGYRVNSQDSVALSQTLFSAGSSGQVDGSRFIFSGFNSGLTIGDFSHVSLVNNGNVDGFSRGINIGETSNIAMGAVAFSYYHNGDIGGNTFLLDSNFNSGTIDGSVFLVNNASNATIDGQYSGVNMTSNGASIQGGTGLFWNNSADFTGGTYSIYLGQLTNSAPGYRIGAISMNNTANMDEEIRFGQFNSTGNARTLTGLDLFASGVITDDGQMIRVNVENLSSTNQYIYSATFQGGKFGVGGSYTPKSSLTVDVGNNISQLVTIQSGSPLTGTDQLLTLIQPSLLVQDDIAMGPIGLGVNMIGAVSQVSVDSGKTVPMLRGMLLGTSVPTGSGGTIDEYVALELLGLPSFGGSVTNPIRTAIQDSPLLGQAFCDGATDCWFLRNNDGDSQNHLARLAIGTTDQKTSANVKLEIRDGHIRSTQATPPTATPDANAGTGATCTLDANATDTKFKVTLVTGAGPYNPGAQCAIAFNQAANVTPSCTFTPTNAAASAAFINTFFPASTGGVSIEFNNPETAPTTYTLDGHCLE